MKQYKLKELRTENKLTAKQLAKKLGIPESTYLSYEKGNTNMPAYIFSSLCDLYQMSRDRVKIPNCNQEYNAKKNNPMGNTFEKTNFMYRKGFHEGFEEAIKQLENVRGKI